jgi:hypothetical protein
MREAAASAGVGRLTDRRMARLYWCLLDRLDYWMTQARLWTVDALYGPNPDGPGNHDGVGPQQLEEVHRGDTPLSRG